MPDADGRLVPGLGRPTGQLGRCVTDAVRDWRRVGIDWRSEVRRSQRLRR